MLFFQFLAKSLLLALLMEAFPCTSGQNEAREIRTPNLLIWSQTRYRCAIAPSVIMDCSDIFFPFLFVSFPLSFPFPFPFFSFPFPFLFLFLSFSFPFLFLFLSLPFSFPFSFPFLSPFPFPFLFLSFPLFFSFSCPFSCCPFLSFPLSLSFSFRVPFLCPYHFPSVFLSFVPIIFLFLSFSFPFPFLSFPFLFLSFPLPLSFSKLCALSELFFERVAILSAFCRICVLAVSRHPQKLHWLQAGVQHAPMFRSVQKPLPAKRRTKKKKKQNSSTLPAPHTLLLAVEVYPQQAVDADRFGPVPVKGRKMPKREITVFSVVLRSRCSQPRNTQARSLKPCWSRPART